MLKNRFLQKTIISATLCAALTGAHASTLTTCPSIEELKTIAQNATYFITVPSMYDVQSKTIKESVLMIQWMHPGAKAISIYPFSSAEYEEIAAPRLIDDNLQLETPTPVTSIAMHDEEHPTETVAEVDSPFCSYVSTKNPEFHVTVWASDANPDQELKHKTHHFLMRK